MVINGYNIIGELNNANSGFSKWGFAKKDGVEYFIKELITPVYPIDRSALSPEMFESRVAYCREFEEKYKELYIAINSASRGNLVRIMEFFRHGSRYYVVTEKVENYSLPREVISKFPLDKKYLLLKSIAHCFRCLHNAGVVHMDVKPNNFMIKQTAGGNCIARLIDFDAGFIVGETREENEELGGDLTYLAPEVFLDMLGQDVEITTKADIFSLGLVFHEYFTGQMPDYDKSEYDYLYEVALDKGRVEPNMALLTPEIGELIAQMLDADPEKRPDADHIHRKLIEITGDKSADFFRAEKVEYSSRFITNIRTTRPEPTVTSSGTVAAAETKVTPEPVTAPKATTKANPWFTNASDL